MQTKEIRIYVEEYEQGLYFYDHLRKVIDKTPIKLIMINKSSLDTNSSLISLLRNHKKFDVILAALVFDKDQKIKEIPVMLLDYSTAMKTEDWQGFDALFWSVYYQVPYSLISSERKSQAADQKLAGGAKLSIQDIQYLIQKSHDVLHHLEWETTGTSQMLLMHSKYASCPPYKTEFEEILKKIIEFLNNSKSIVDFYFSYTQSIKRPEPSTFSAIFPPENSNRTKWESSKNEFTLKINRFGHGMEPERGGLAFFRLIADSLQKPFTLIAEFQIQRKGLAGKESYHALFDAAGKEKELMELAEQIFLNGNVIEFQNAIKIFSLATKSQDIFNNNQSKDNEITLNDSAVQSFLESSQSSEVRNILLYANAIVLTDLNRIPIVRIVWNHSIVDDYFQGKKTKTSQILTPLTLKTLTQENMKADLVTYGCLNLFKSVGLQVLENIVVSGSDIDLIAIVERGFDYDLILLETKDDINKCKKDVEKLNDMRFNHLQDLQLLIENVIGKKKILTKVYIGVAGKQAKTVKHYSLDFHIMITLKANSNTNPSLDWTIDLRNKKMMAIFHGLLGKYELEKKINVADT